jgi:hypothetical protein
MLRWLGLAIALQLLTAGALLTSNTVTLTSPPPPIDDDESTDLYGNDVTPAVATYSFDAAGSVYELHSPHTEIPHLGSPKS